MYIITVISLVKYVVDPLSALSPITHLVVYATVECGFTVSFLQ